MIHQNFIASAHLGLFLIGASFASAAVTLQIDVSNPSAVKITSTAAFSQGDSTLTVGFEGFTIQNLFKTPVLIFQDTLASSSNLRPAGTSDSYEGLATVNLEGNSGVYEASNDLNIFSTTPPYENLQIFSTTGRAFDGTLTYDFSAIAAALPAAGTTGSVLSGYVLSGIPQHGVTIGQYQIIPEPATSTIAVFGMAWLCCSRRRK